MILNMVLPDYPMYRWEKWSVNEVPIYSIVLSNVEYVGIEYDLAPDDGTSSTTKTTYALSVNSSGVISGTPNGTADAISNQNVWFYYPNGIVGSKYVKYVGLFTDYTYRAAGAQRTGTSYEKGSTYYGEVTDLDPNAYPDDGAQDGYYYVKVTT